MAAETYTIDEVEYTAADVAKLDDSEYEHLLARTKTLNLPEDQAWVEAARAKGSKKAAKDSDDE
jgi:hypothetical protein